MKTGAGAFTFTNARVETWGYPERGEEAWPSPTSVSVAGQQASPPSATHPWPSRLQMVGVLAFIQSLLFLVIWLWICAAAGAGAPPKAEFNPELQQSRYDPVKERDPFSKSGVTSTDAAVPKPAPAATYVFHLQGILYQPRDPSAIVDGTLLSLNKTVTLNVGNGGVQVKAVEITRSHVVLEVGGQKVELRMSVQNTTPPQP